MQHIKICEYCGKEFQCKMSNAKFCSLNCRANNLYHTRNVNAKKYELNKTEEQKREENTLYQREYYKNNKQYRERHKEMRRNYYKIHKEQENANAKERYKRKKEGK